MAIRLSETFRILEQQEKRAAEEKNQIGRDLFLRAEDMLKQTTELAEEAGIKLAATAYGRDGGEAATETAAQAEAPQEAIATPNVPEQNTTFLSANQNISAIDSIKQQMSQIYHEKKVNETKKTAKDTLKDEILGVITKALDDKDKN